MATTCLESIAGKLFPIDLVKRAQNRLNVTETPTESQKFKVNTAATFGPVASSPTLLGELGPQVRPQLGKGPDVTTKQYA